jgi:amidohydrolase
MTTKDKLAIALTILAFSGAPAVGGIDPVATKVEVDAILAKTYPHLEALYKDIHSHPELAFQETRTAALLATEMRHLGFTVTEKVGGTGIVAIYHNGSGPVVLVRTELDALPIEEETELPYASKVQIVWTQRPGVTLMSGQHDNGSRQMTVPSKTFVSHVCGHDSHMAWWVGTAETLLMLKSQWSGTLMFIGQPAEETLSGAKAMLADGLFTRFPKPAFGFAAHVAPLPAGSILLKDGTALSAADNLAITFLGRGGHGARPSDTIDPIVISAHFVSDVQAIISREKDSIQPGVITVGSFQAGTSANIIPDHADLKLTLRSTMPGVRAALRAGVLRTAKAVADMANAPTPEISLLSGTAPLINDAQLDAEEAAAMKSAFGDKFAFVPATEPAGMASEDFSELINAGMPSAYFTIGGTTAELMADYKAKGQPIPVNHSPYFHPAPEPTIKTGVEVLTLAVMMVAQPQSP